MSEKELKMSELERQNRDNSRLIELAKQNAGISEAKVLNYQKRIEQLKKQHELELSKLQAQLDRAVENAKLHHDTIDSLIQKRENLHTEWKSTMHLGEVQCQYCHLYFKNNEVLARHQNVCAAKPEIKIVADQENDITQKKDDLLARREALEEELKKLEVPEPKFPVPFKKQAEEQKEIAEKLREHADELNGLSKSIMNLIENHKDWISEYSIEEGGKAIWQGRITKGFQTWCEAKGYELEL